MSTHLLIVLVSGIFVAAASGIVGSFLVLRRMTLLSDSLSHVALPGVALGVLWHLEPLVGGLVSLFLGVLIIWAIEHKTKLAIESITGVLFVTALAIGAILIPEPELLETFFGSIENVTIAKAIMQMAIATGVIGIALAFLKPLVLSSIAPDLTSTARISHARMQLLLLTLIAFTIAIGISFVGILLMSALTIVPAVTARNLAQSLKGFILLSVFLSILSLAGGLFAHSLLDVNLGAATVLLGATFFGLSLFKRS